MACALTQGYNLDCIDSQGGMKAAHVIEFANVTTITSSAGVVTGITKATGKQFWKYNLVKQTGSFEESNAVNEETGSNMVTQSVKFPLNKLTATVANELRLLSKNRLMVVAVDSNGKGWLLGRDGGIILKTSKAGSGVKFSDRNGYELEFEGMEKELAYEVDSATLATLQTVGS
jgi:hypothetical protein